MNYFVDDELIQYIVEQSTVYCLSKNWPDLKVKCEKIKVFLAILICQAIILWQVKPFIGQQVLICIIQQCIGIDLILLGNVYIFNQIQRLIKKINIVSFVPNAPSANEIHGTLHPRAKHIS